MTDALMFCPPTQGKPGMAAAAAKAAAKAGKESADGFLAGLVKAALKNWVLSLLALLCAVSGVIVFLDALVEARAYVKRAGF